MEVWLIMYWPLTRSHNQHNICPVLTNSNNSSFCWQLTSNKWNWEVSICLAIRYWTTVEYLRNLMNIKSSERDWTKAFSTKYRTVMHNKVVLKIRKISLSFPLMRLALKNNCKCPQTTKTQPKIVTVWVLKEIWTATTPINQSNSLMRSTTLPSSQKLVNNSNIMINSNLTLQSKSSSILIHSTIYSK